MEVPFVPKEAVSIIAVGDVLEAVTLRAVLERFNYRVEVHWVGSRKELLEILHGAIPTNRYLVLSCHGDMEDGILVPNEPAIKQGDLAQVHLPHHIIVNLGCGTGTAAIADCMLTGECEAYIAPIDEVEANSALLFIIHLFYYLGMKKTLKEAFVLAQSFDNESGLFRIWVPTSILS